VFNVSMPLLTRSFSDRPPFRVFELPASPNPSRDVTPQLVGGGVGERRSGERRG
jgi:hypothetical protein